MVGILDFLRGAEIAPTAPINPSQAGSAAQFWAGAVNEALANNGDRLVRLPDGSVQRTSARYGWTETDRPGGSGGGLLNSIGGADTPAGGGLLGSLASTSQQPASMEPSIKQGAQPVGRAQGAGSAYPANTGSSKGIGGFLGWLFGVDDNEGARRGTIQWLVNKGFDPGVAEAVASDPQTLRSAMIQYGGPQGKSEYQQRAEALQTLGIPLNSPEGRAYFLTEKLPSDGGDTWINVGGGRVFNTRSGEFRTSPDRGTDAPTVQTFYDDQGREYKAEWSAQKGEWVPVGGAKAPSGMSLRTNPDGTVELVQGNGAGQKITEGQSKDVLYYTRGIDANQQLDQFETELTDLAQSSAEMIPLGLGNYIQSPQFQQAKQAGDNFLAAILRKDTGAAVTKQEFQLYGKMFLPVPGDSSEVVQQKRRARQVALEAVKSGMGTAEAIAKANEIKLGISEGPLAKTPGINGNGNQTGSGAGSINRTRSGLPWRLEN